MNNAEQVLAVGGGVVIWLATAVTNRRRRRRGGAAGPSVSGPALATLWAAFFGSRYGLLVQAEHSATFRAHVGDLAATWLDVQDAVGPYLVVTAVITLVSRALAVLVPRSEETSQAAPAGQVPVAE